MTDSIRARLVGFDNEAWNNPWHLYIGIPVLAVLGVLIGSLYGVHLVSSGLSENLIVVLCLAITMVIGLVGLACFDMRK